MVTHLFQLPSGLLKPIVEGTQSFHVTFIDADYRVGDNIVFQELDRDSASFTGFEILMRIVYIQPIGHPTNLAVLGIKPPISRRASKTIMCSECGASLVIGTHEMTILNAVCGACVARNS